MSLNEKNSSLLTLLLSKTKFAATKMSFVPFLIRPHDLHAVIPPADNQQAAPSLKTVRDHAVVSQYIFKTSTSLMVKEPALEWALSILTRDSRLSRSNVRPLLIKSDLLHPFHISSIGSGLHY